MTTTPCPSGPPGRPFSARSAPARRLRRAAVAAVLAASVGCATGGGPAPGPTPPDERTDGGAPRPAEEALDAGSAALDAVDRLVEAGRFRAAAVLADSLYFQTRVRPDLAATAAEALSREARALERAGDLAAAAERLEELLRRYPERAGDDVPTRLARLLVARADDPAAAAVLLRRPGGADAAVLRLVRRAGRSMSVAELESVLGDAPAAGEGDASGRRAVRAALTAELAVALARAGRLPEARAAARDALEGSPRETDAARARSVLQGSVAPRAGPVRIGLLVPRTGRFAPVGRRLREGVELALDAHAGGGPPVELSVADTGPDSVGLAGLVARLEEQGAVALLGPVRTEGLRRAAAARADSGRLLISPTATRAEAAPPAVYTLWDRNRRKLDAARRLGRWMSEALGSVPVGAVYPAGAAGRRAYLEFRRELGPGEAWVAAAHPYESGATTLEGPITAVSAFGPRGVFAPGGGSTSVLQMAPQLSYYGVRGAIVAGGPAWSRPSVVRRLEPSYSQYRVLGAFVDRWQRGGAWNRFETSYEKKYRRSLSGNVLPALGHDAARVVLEALRDVRPPRPRAVARRAAELASVAGATGRFRLEPATGTAVREVLVRALEKRALAPASVRSARAWLASSGRLETARLRSRRQRALGAVRDLGVALSPSEAADGGSR